MATTYRTAAVLIAGVFTAALTYATVELPTRLARVAADWIDVPDIHPAIEPEAIRAFIENNNLHLIAWACLTAVAVAIVAGLGVLRVLWLPAWEGGLMALGDVAYLPYMAIVWPLSLVGVDARGAVALAAIAIGLFVFMLGTVTWLLARFEGREVADSLVYRWSRHPQYIGWIVWSWGMMLVAAQQPVPMAGQNPGAALAWMVATLVIVAVAWAEERAMEARAGAEWLAYRDRTPFLVPVPDVVARMAGLPVRLVTAQRRPATGRQIFAAFLACLGVGVALSVPFALLAWPPYGWWAWPTFAPATF
jgi:protein-S-isoprenylcysteine O-methyltransferase Ste14